ESFRDVLGGEIDAGQEPGGKVVRELIVVVVDVDQGEAGRSGGDAGNRVGLALPPARDPVGVGGGGADAVAPATSRDAGAFFDRVGGLAVVLLAGQAVAERAFAACR